MFNFIRNFITHKAKSIEEFQGVIKSEGCKTVTVDPQSVPKGGAQTETVGTIANFQYMLNFTTTTPRGRKITYQERLFERFGSERGLADAIERRDSAIKLFLIAEQKVNTFKETLPDVSVDFIGPDGQLMDKILFTKLHQDATACNISI